MSFAPSMPDREPSGAVVRYVDLARQFAEEQVELMPEIVRALEGGEHVDGPDISRLEDDLQDFLGVGNVIAVNSGTDALILSLKALGIGNGDEVITPPNSFVATCGAIIAAGATPVFADVMADQNIDPEDIARKITPRTKAVMPVHLTGRCARMDEINGLAEAHDLYVVEDAAQAIGSRYDDRQAGSMGHVGCFSTHPLKNLNSAGDGGFIATNDEEIATHCRLARSHGLENRETVVQWGTVSRMDTIQAATLRFRLQRLDGIIERRRANATLYRDGLAKTPVFTPPDRNEEFNTYHTFVIQADDRDRLREHLTDMGIETAVHYPLPIHLQPAAVALGYGEGDFPVTEAQAQRIVSLPIHQFLQPDDIDTVCNAIADFYA